MGGDRGMGWGGGVPGACRGEGRRLWHAVGRGRWGGVGRGGGMEWGGGGGVRRGGGGGGVEPPIKNTVLHCTILQYHRMTAIFKVNVVTTDYRA